MIYIVKERRLIFIHYSKVNARSNADKTVAYFFRHIHRNDVFVAGFEVVVFFVCFAVLYIVLLYAVLKLLFSRFRTRIAYCFTILRHP